MAKRKGENAAAPRRVSMRPPQAPGGARGRRQASAAGAPRGIWLYGVHPALAALANQRRRVRRVALTAEVERRHGEAIAAALADCDHRPEIEKRPRTEISALLPAGAVKLGLAVLGLPLPATSLDQVCRSAGSCDSCTVVVLDQVSDPQNVGAVMRSAAAFGSLALVVQDRHAPRETGALAKAASGALERLPMVRVSNLARALKALQAAGFWCVGLTRGAEPPLTEIALIGRIAFVLGAEGAGLRRLTAERCDALAGLPTVGPIADLNVSNAAAVALYEAERQRRSRATAGPVR
ncbi:MAG: 23S rRNA (guanosine(2251)-2'-O)-methyltransferase RlmB [Kiloniellales bacterium]